MPVTRHIKTVPEWRYRPAVGPVAVRRLDVYEHLDGSTVTCVLTEQPDDEGMSITNAAEIIYETLCNELPNRAVRVIEHYISAHDEHFDAVIYDGFDRVQWRRMDQAEIEAVYGPSIFAFPH